MKNKTTKPFFSIVIPSLNEEKYLPRLLKNLSQQSYENFEVIHVDASSKDKTVAKAARFAKKLKLKTIVVDKQNVSFQRNTGAKNAQGKWVIFMDADNRLPNYFLQGIKYQLEKNEQVDIFTCWIDMSAYSTANKPVIIVSNLAVELASRMKPLAYGALIGAKKSVTRRIKFKEILAMLEDMDFVNEGVKNHYHFKCFRDPRYIYSLRRYRKEGLLKTLRTTAKVNLKLLREGQITGKFKDYPMLGGAYYDKKASSLLNKINHFFVSASKRQLQQAKKLLSLFELEE